jgi:hypothetical protein
MEGELDADDLSAVMTLVLMKQEDINSLEAAALSILELNKLDVSDEILEKTFENTTLDKVVENANLFAHYGIIPNVEVVDGMSGGVKREREEESPPQPPPRSRTPSKKMAEAIASPFVSAAQQKRDEKAVKAAAKAERSARLSEVDVSKQFQGKEYDDLTPYLKGLDVCQPKTASQFMRALFPEKAVTIWTEVLKKNCRDIYEPSAVESQCNNVIGKVRDVDKCYICGFDFDDKTEGLQPTCEHILPIIQAIFFLDLYRGADKGKHTPEQMDILRKEYAWAHRCCNYVKGDNSFLVTKIDRSNNMPRWDFGINQTTKVLSDIHKTYKYEGTTTVQALISAKGYDVWLQERLGYIKTEKMDNITKYISDRGMGGTIIMIGFGNCVDSTKMNDDFKEILQKIEKGEDLSGIKPSKKARRMTMGGKTFRHTNNGKLSTSRKGRS